MGDGDSGRKIEAGIDWFTATLPAGHAASGATYRAGFDLLEHVSQQGNKSAELSKLGYRGVQCGKLFIGESPQGLLIVATGDVSSSAYEHLYIPEMHVSRLDLQVTQWYPPDGDNTGTVAEMHAGIHKRSGVKGAKRQIRHIKDDEGGFTLYIGSRSSVAMLRLYNKGAESKTEYYLGAWRYEVEMKNELATQTALYLLQSKQSREGAILATVKAFCQQRGLYPLWSTEDGLNVLRPLPKDESDDIRTIKWLTSQVRPTIQRLIRQGYSADVAQALGIDIS